jgi:hypothetical protein
LLAVIFPHVDVRVHFLRPRRCRIGLEEPPHLRIVVQRAV